MDGCAGRRGSDLFRTRDEDCLKAALDIEAGMITDFWLFEQPIYVEMSLVVP